MSDTPLPPTAPPPETPAPASAEALAPSAEPSAAPKPLLNPLQNDGPPPSSTNVEPPKSPLRADPASTVASAAVSPAPPAPASNAAKELVKDMAEGTNVAESTPTPAPAPADGSAPALQANGSTSADPNDQPPLPVDAPVPPSPQPKDEEPPVLPPGAIPSAVPTPTVILTEEQALASGGASTAAPASSSPLPPATPATPSVAPGAVEPPSEPVPTPTATAFPSTDGNAMDVDGDADAQGEEDDTPMEQSEANGNGLKRAGEALERRDEKRVKEEQSRVAPAPSSAPAAPAPVLAYIPGTPHPEYRPHNYDQNLPSSPLTAGQHKHLLTAVRGLKKNPLAFAFLQPVDPVLLNIPHYPTVVKSPMDLGTVETKLIVSDPRGPPKDKSKVKNWDESKGRYGSVLGVATDVRQIWENTRMFNGPNHDVSLNANKLDSQFEKALKALPAERPTPASAPSPAAAGPSQTPFRRPSMSQIPAIRRSDDGTDRPKREIHPPPSKDVGYAETSRKPKRRSDPQLQYVAKQFRSLESKQYESVTSAFFYPVSEIIANIPAYSEVIKKPIDLNIIRQRFADGEYEDIAQVQSDMELVWTNALKFNRPGDAYHTAAGQLKQLWQDKMKGMPPKESPREESEDPLAAPSDTESDGEYSTTITTLKQQVTFLQQQIAELEAKRAAAKSAKAAKSSKGKSGSRRQSVSKATSAAFNGNGHAHPKKPRKSKDASTAAPAYKDDYDSEEEAAPAPLTLRQKEELAAKISNCDHDTLNKAVRIIQENMEVGSGNEIELDIEQLPQHTVIQLYKLVCGGSGRKPGRPKGSGAGGAAAKKQGRKGPGGGSRKHMNEAEEAERIRRMEAQLQSFNNQSMEDPSAHRTAREGYDSDESSEEEDSDED